MRLSPTAWVSLAALLSSGCALSVPVEALAPVAGPVELRAPVRRADRVRFAAVGDFGRDSAVQREVARGVHRACAGDCDFVTLLGDNLYWEGLRPERREEDAATLRCLVNRYPGPKYLVLGNHDYHPVFTDPERAEAQLKVFAEPGDDLFGGHHFYEVDAGLVRLFAIDTNLLVRGEEDLVSDGRVEAFGERIEGSDAPWTIAFGHHPVLSNGEHGDAGSFVEKDRYSFWSGGGWRDFFLRHVVGHAALYLSGHEHNLQFYGRAFGADTGLAVSGSGSKATARSASPLHDDALLERYGHGFAVVEATPTQLTIEFHDATGEPFWRASRPRVGRWHGRRSVDPRHRQDEEIETLRARDAAAGGVPCPTDEGV